MPRGTMTIEEAIARDDAVTQILQALSPFQDDIARALLHVADGLIAAGLRQRILEQARRPRAGERGPDGDPV